MKTYQASEEKGTRALATLCSDPELLKDLCVLGISWDQAQEMLMLPSGCRRWAGGREMSECLNLEVSRGGMSASAEERAQSHSCSGKDSLNGRRAWVWRVEEAKTGQETVLLFGFTFPFRPQKPVCTIPAHDGPLAALTFNSAGSKLASASEKVSERSAADMPSVPARLKQHVCRDGWARPDPFRAGSMWFCFRKV